MDLCRRGSSPFTSISRETPPTGGVGPRSANRPRALHIFPYTVTGGEGIGGDRGHLIVHIAVIPQYFPYAGDYTNRNFRSGYTPLPLMDKQ